MDSSPKVRSLKVFHWNLSLTLSVLNERNKQLKSKHLLQFSLKTGKRNTRHDIDLFLLSKTKKFKLNALFSTLASCRFLFAYELCALVFPLDVVFVVYNNNNKLREETFHLWFLIILNYTLFIIIKWSLTVQTRAHSKNQLYQTTYTHTPTLFLFILYKKYMDLTHFYLKFFIIFIL